ncbi:MAG TPA: hypothetical protein VJU15_09265 [Gemmatimonadales bacterium]|nr:hypothetical protein [Gemmatimonadales bacterium]
MPYLLLTALLQIATPPRVEVRGVEVSGVWLGLSSKSHVAVYLRGPDGIRLLSPDSLESWAPLDSGSVPVELPLLPSAAISPVNCIITERDVYRWEVATRTVTPLKVQDCGTLPPSTTGPGRAIPGRPTQDPGDAWYIRRPNDAADRDRYLIVFALDADFRPGNPRKALDDRLHGTPVLYAARAIGGKLAVPAWEAVVVKLR